jgi:hypothetical protein
MKNMSDNFSAMRQVVISRIENIENELKTAKLDVHWTQSRCQQNSEKISELATANERKWEEINHRMMNIEQQELYSKNGCQGDSEDRNSDCSSTKSARNQRNCTFDGANCKEINAFRRRSNPNEEECDESDNFIEHIFATGSKRKEANDSPKSCELKSVRPKFGTTPHHCRTSRLKLPEYDGSYEAGIFISQLHKVVEMNRWNDEETCAHIITSLKGQARVKFCHVFHIPLT